MTPPGARPGEPGRHVGRVRELVLLAWPTCASYLLNSGYRINDQFWVQGLGGSAQAAIGAVFFLQVLAFALMYLSVGGALALVSRAVGARDTARRDSVVRHALLFAAGIGLLLTAVVRPLADELVALLGLSGDAAALATDYLRTLYLFAIPMALFPTVDAIFIARGNTRVPMVLGGFAVAANFVLNPVLIYGASGAEGVDLPGVGSAAAIAGAFGVEGRGMAGAALATGLARCVAVGLGIVLLATVHKTSLVGSWRPRLSRLARIGGIGAPVSASIAVYAGVYFALFGLVIAQLGEPVQAGLGIGFQVFEGVAFPCYLGISIGGASLVGRAIGARDPDLAWDYVRSARFVGRVLGVFFALLFLAGGPLLVPLFTEDERVLDATLLYVATLALSQYWVSVEAVNEKVLVGAGQTGSIVWIGPLGNVLRIPLAWLLALAFGWGAAGVWWAINLTTYLKAGLFWHKVQRSPWLEHALAEDDR